MSAQDTIDVLSRLSVLHNRSLPMYLHYATPWIPGGESQELDVLDHVVADQTRTVDRLGAMIIEYGGDVRAGEFPMSFTSLHDLSFDYLLKLMIQRQRQLIADIEDCVAALKLAPVARSVTEETLGEARGHLRSLEECSQRSAAK